MLIAFSGPIGAGTSDLSARVAERLGWPRVKFSDTIRRIAAEQSSDPNELEVLQALGQSLVVDRLSEFVAEVLASADWRGDQNLIVDGLRHIEVKTEMLRQIGAVPLHVVHVERSRPERAQRRGLDEARLEQLDRELSEAQLERILPQYANCILDGSQDHDELADRVIQLFTGGDKSRIDTDAQEPVDRMMPLLIGEGSPRRKAVADRAAELLQRSKKLSAMVPTGLERPLAGVVRAMNSYYSNRIEGHITLPIDIERALKHHYSDDRERRNKQLEARAHIAVQSWIDEGNVPLDRVTEQEILKQIHNQFFSHVPEEFHWVRDKDTGEEWRVTPGQYRQRYVRVGDHISISPGAVPRFMEAFERGYRQCGTTDRILAVAAAHHRLLWIHPFLDGNGRVARLMTDAMLRAVLESSGAWSVTRGFARDVGQYKGLLAQCDLQRRNDLDGRGNLSEEALVAFTLYLLETALDQVDYMERMVQPDRFAHRLRTLLEEEKATAKLSAAVEPIVLHLALSGPTRRADLIELAGRDPKDLDESFTHLAGVGLIASDGECDRIELPFKLLPILLPGLFPDD
jgi:Fic family protein/adenylate kinase family enzyme